MKTVLKECILGLVLVGLFAGAAAAQNARGTSAIQKSMRAPDRMALEDFSRRAQAYVQLREKIENEIGELPTKATPEQIEAHQVKFRQAMLAARAGARQGDIFTPDASRVIRQIIAEEFRGRDRDDLRKTVFEAENATVPVGVNTVYPEAAEILEMPPTLLLTLPQLPKQLRYRFVGTYMLLMDRENHVIVDYMTEALP